MDKNEIKLFVKQWMDSFGPDSFVKNQFGVYIYTAGPHGIELVSLMEDLLESYVEALKEGKYDPRRD
jgi:hypothetical protein